MPLYHMTYRDRQGGVRVRRITSDSRSGAIGLTAILSDVPRSNVLSAVKLPAVRVEDRPESH